MSIIRSRLTETGVPLQVWDAFIETWWAEARGRPGMSLKDVERLEADRIGPVEVIAGKIGTVPAPTTGEPITVAEASRRFDVHAFQIHRWIRYGFIPVLSREGTTGPLAETVIDKGALEATIAAVKSCPPGYRTRHISERLAAMHRRRSRELATA